MNIKTWKLWVRSKPWYLKWFIILILIRPFVDAFYNLKEVSVFLSPLYWIGVLTPILCVIGIIQSKYIRSNSDQMFYGWAIVGFVASVVIFFDNRDIFENIERFLRLTLPFFLFLFLRVFIRNKNDLHGIMIAFLISCIPVFFIMLYELIFTPIGVGRGRGDLIRYHGVYADVLNYSIHIIVGFLFIGYFYIKDKLHSYDIKISTAFFIMVLGICIIGLLQIKHNTSYALFSVIFSLFLFYSFRKDLLRAFGILLLILSATFLVGSEIYEQTISPSVERELNVYREGQDQSQYFTGRVGRWEFLWEDFNSVHMVSKLFGVNFEFGNYYYLTTGHVHSDYFRILFFTGYIGFIFYILWLIGLFKKVKYLSLSGKYIGIGSLLVLLLYSVSTLPWFYPSLLYPILSVFAFLALPKKVINNEERV